MSEPSRQRLLDLLALEALGGLDPEAEAELEALRGLHPDVDDEGLSRLAAVIARVELGPADPIPPRLAAKIQADAAAHLPRRPAPRRRWPATLAAAALLIAAAAWVLWPTEARWRERLLRDPATLRLAGQGVPSPGEVVWNNARQEGYLRLDGLPPNDPGVSQYQLWIFDAERDERFPVDGGVFDVPPGGAVVPIRAKLSVGRPTLFAVTRERPGGVVVSDRKAVVLAAKVQ